MPLENTLAPRVLAWLQATRRARVLHRFEQVCNLVNQDRLVISLQTTAVGMGPFSWVVPAALLAPITPETPVHCDTGEILVLGSERLSAAGAAVWPPRPDWAALRNSPPRPLDHPLAPETGRWFAALLDHLADRDGPGAVAAAAKLTGRGPGVTPAGDDLLMGLCHALWVRGWAESWTAKLAAAAVPLTTALSGAFLAAAAGGEATIHWHDLAAGRPGAAERIWAIGHTSGRDAWTGYSAGWHRLGTG